MSYDTSVKKQRTHEADNESLSVSFGTLILAESSSFSGVQEPLSGYWSNTVKLQLQVERAWEISKWLIWCHTSQEGFSASLGA